jgi:hypothetical protein
VGRRRRVRATATPLRRGHRLTSARTPGCGQRARPGGRGNRPVAYDPSRTLSRGRPSRPGRGNGLVGRAGWSGSVTACADWVAVWVNPRGRSAPGRQRRTRRRRRRILAWEAPSVHPSVACLSSLVSVVGVTPRTARFWKRKHPSFQQPRGLTSAWVPRWVAEDLGRCRDGGGVPAHHGLIAGAAARAAEQARAAAAGKPTPDPQPQTDWQKSTSPLRLAC